MPTPRMSMAALQRAPISFANPYGGMDQNAINEAAAEIETAGARDARIRHSMAMDMLREEEARARVRSLDPTTAAMDAGRAADWQAGFFRNNPQVREAKRQSDIFAAGTAGMAEGEKEYQSYFTPGMGDVRESQDRRELARITERYTNPAIIRGQAQLAAEQARLERERVAGASRAQAARTGAVGRVAGSQITAQPGSFDTATEWFEEQTGPKGQAVPMSQIRRRALEHRIPLDQAISDLEADGYTIDYAR